MIDPNHLAEFEQLGVGDLQKRLDRGLYDEAKRKAAHAWLDDQEHGEDRRFKAEQLRLQRRSDLKSTISLVVAALALLVSIFAALEKIEPRQLPYTHDAR